MKKAQPHILFLSYDGMTDPLGQSQVIPYLAGLTRFGYRFTILSFDKPEKYALHKNEVENQIANFPITWKSITYHKNPPVLSGIYDLMLMKKFIRKAQKNEPFDMVHARTGIPALAALWMKKKFGTPFLNDIRGFWADERIDGGMWHMGNPVYKVLYHYFKSKEKECIEQADFNNCLTGSAQKEILSWKNIKGQPRPVSVISCSADVALFDPANIDPAIRNNFLHQLHINESDFIISYLGSIGGWYLTKEMMAFCKVLQDEIPNTVFLFISPGRHPEIREAAKAAGILESSIKIISARRKEVPVLLSLSSYSLFFIKPCYSKMASSPTKHGEIMAMGIPVITNAGVGDVKEIVLQNEAGYVLESLNGDEYRQVAEKLKDPNPFSAEKIRAAALRIYSLQSAIEAYHKVYRAILPGT